MSRSLSVITSYSIHYTKLYDTTDAMNGGSALCLHVIPLGFETAGFWLVLGRILSLHVIPLGFETQESWEVGLGTAVYM